MRRPKDSSNSPRPRPEDSDADAIDINAAELADVDWDALPRHSVDLDPVLIEQIRSRNTLKQITLRVGEEQIHVRHVCEHALVKRQVVGKFARGFDPYAHVGWSYFRLEVVHGVDQLLLESAITVVPMLELFRRTLARCCT